MPKIKFSGKFLNLIEKGSANHTNTNNNNDDDVDEARETLRPTFHLKRTKSCETCLALFKMCQKLTKLVQNHKAKWVLRMASFYSLKLSQL